MGIKSFGAMKVMLNVQSESLGVKRILHVRVVVATVMFGAETSDFRIEERHKLNVIQMKSFRSMCGVTRTERWKNEGVRRGAGVI